MIKMICLIIFLVKVLLDQYFTSYDMALWIQIINFMLEFLPNTQEFSNKNECPVTTRFSYGF